MAALAPIATPARQPFGILNDSKVRSLQSMKNRQNAITPSSAPSLKRRAVSPEVGSDSENVDPNILDSLNKRKRSAFDDDVSASKSHRYSLNVTSASLKPRLDRPVISTPRLDTFVKPSSITPASAPAAAAGRSLTRRRSSLLKPHKRFNPPSSFLSTQSPSLSISAALSGTKKSRKLHQSRKSQSQSRSRTIQDSKPQSWFFDIYEETEETQEYRMNEWTMTQSATGLEISDDESKAASKSNKLDRGKENVDPNEQSAPVTRSMAAAAARNEKDISVMTDDEPRTPLGDLNPVAFYAEGLDATSVVLVQDDDAEAETDIEEDVEVKAASEDFTFQAPPTSLTAKAIEAFNTPSLSQILSSTTPYVSETGIVAMEDQPNAAIDNEDAVTEIEIWESESAKDEQEKVDVEVEVPGTPGSVGVGDENAFALQEL
ncbi:hypothetical protein, variant [Exophiala sideris]|uniref:Uncharacterized protein n=1 Tax=Exophiala sideris TaxID=1016849 RepID=A0A0D1YX67_9EURO|nr:hypothetical protein PV11_02717 [Exophiala sideris]KIV87152.1 hypothetical protein, variant [Exophiala sideris]